MPYSQNSSADINIYFVHVPNDTDTTIGVAFMNTACLTPPNAMYKSAVIEYAYPTDVQNAQVCHFNMIFTHFILQTWSPNKL
jgi:hypothetical protein